MSFQKARSMEKITDPKPHTQTVWYTPTKSQPASQPRQPASHTTSQSEERTVRHTDRHLTVFPIEQLEAFDVLRLYVLRQGFPLQIDVRELRERSRCVWGEGGGQRCHTRSRRRQRKYPSRGASPHPHAGKRRQRLTAAEVLVVLSKQAPPLTQELLVLLHLGADVREPRPLLLLA